MPHDVDGDATVLFQRARAGDLDAREELFRRLHHELTRRADRVSRNPADSMTPSSLVQDAILKLVQVDALASVNDRAHLLALATRVMWQVLIEHHRQRKTAIRGGGRKRQPLDDALDRVESSGYDLLMLHEAIEELGKLSERQALIASLRILSGMNHEETAEQIGASRSLVEKEWRSALAWLKVWFQESTR